MEVSDSSITNLKELTYNESEKGKSKGRNP